MKPLWKGRAIVFIGMAAMRSFSAIWTGANARADEGTVTASSSKTDLDTQLARSSTSNSATIEELRQEIQAEHRRTLQLEQRLDALQQNQNSTAQKQTSLEHVMTNLQVGRGNETTPNGTSQADVYDRGFFLRSKNGKFSLSINGLMQYPL